MKKYFFNLLIFCLFSPGYLTAQKWQKISFINQNSLSVKLEWKIDKSQFKMNPDGKFYKTSVRVICKNNSNNQVYIIPDDIYTSGVVNSGADPCMIIDPNENFIMVFVMEKDNNPGNYGMNGFVYVLNKGNNYFKKEIVFTGYNSGWWAYFFPTIDEYPTLAHFSFDGYKSVFSKRNSNGTWSYVIKGDQAGDIAKKEWEEHDKILITRLNIMPGKSSQEANVLEISNSKIKPPKQIEDIIKMNRRTIYNEASINYNVYSYEMSNTNQVKSSSAARWIERCGTNLKVFENIPETYRYQADFMSGWRDKPTGNVKSLKFLPMNEYLQIKSSEAQFIGMYHDSREKNPPILGPNQKVILYYDSAFIRTNNTVDLSLVNSKTIFIEVKLKRIIPDAKYGFSLNDKEFWFEHHRYNLPWGLSLRYYAGLSKYFQNSPIEKTITVGNLSLKDKIEKFPQLNWNYRYEEKSAINYFGSGSFQSGDGGFSNKMSVLIKNETISYYFNDYLIKVHKTDALNPVKLVLYSDDLPAYEYLMISYDDPAKEVKINNKVFSGIEGDLAYCQNLDEMEKFLTEKPFLKQNPLAQKKYFNMIKTVNDIHRLKQFYPPEKSIFGTKSNKFLYVEDNGNDKYGTAISNNEIIHGYIRNTLPNGPAVRITNNGTEKVYFNNGEISSKQSEIQIMDYDWYVAKGDEKNLLELIQASNADFMRIGDNYNIFIGGRVKNNSSSKVQLILSLVIHEVGYLNIQYVNLLPESWRMFKINDPVCYYYLEMNPGEVKPFLGLIRNYKWQSPFVYKKTDKSKIIIEKDFFFGKILEETLSAQNDLINKFVTYGNIEINRGFLGNGDAWLVVYNKTSLEKSSIYIYDGDKLIESRDNVEKSSFLLRANNRYTVRLNGKDYMVTTNDGITHFTIKDKNTNTEYQGK